MPEPTNEQLRITSKTSMHKAYELLRSLRPANKKTLKKKKITTKFIKVKKKQSDYKKDRLLKSLVIDLSKWTRKIPWQENFVIEEMRNSMSKHDWISLHRLYPYCGIETGAIQPIRFTYSFILCLCSHISNEIYFKNFLATCISRNFIDKGILERLMTLQKTYHHKEIIRDDDENESNE